jgi:SAM-dependent methyltransferase
MQRLIGELGAGARAVVLGLTPEIVGCAWPDDVNLTAVDHSPAMIRALWPPKQGPADAKAVLADWRDMPIASGSIDLVVGDGCFIVQAYPEGFEALAQEVRRVLAPSGRFAIRVFLRPDQPESIADIARALARGKIGSVHALKLRLLAAVYGASVEGGCLDDAWRAWQSLPLLPAALAGRPGWTKEEVTGIEGYRGLENRHFLPTLQEFRTVLSSMLTEVSCDWGRYELADRCPTLVFARDGDS